eukprot:GEZU01011028.1.p1 GENE.GEZU01011028.1~~GEZU01011028.1.p1  ORF type:complete len:503 (-),score=97.50 GEZU01011028.1:68-1576(-)
MTKNGTISLFNACLTFLNFAVLVFFGFVEEFFLQYVLPYVYPSKYCKKKDKYYAPLVADFDDFFNRRMFYRAHDCWNRPIASRPGAWIDVMERVRETDPKKWKRHGQYTLTLTGKLIRCLNLSSYNYLGFADNEESCNKAVIESLHKYGAATSSPSMELGRTAIHEELESRWAKFLGKQSSMIFGMGFATNSTTIPALVGKGDLIISDSLNHASIIIGSRSSGAKIKTYQHDNMKHLEKVIRESIAEGQPRTHRPWRKIIILVEGIYSMEGDIVDLQTVVALKKKYKCYLYVDEAHSIGALGKTGRGVVEHCGVDPKDVDVMMGTFTKSFASVGGYIAGDKDLIRHLRVHSWGSIYAESMSTPCAQQIISALKVITGEDGTDIGAKKLRALRENANYFRRRLVEMGFQVYGSDDSPVVPIMIYNPAKNPSFSRSCLERNVAVVVVGYPATALMESRARFCLSAAHTIEDLDGALEVIDELGELNCLKYDRALVQTRTKGKAI